MFNASSSNLAHFVNCFAAFIDGLTSLFGGDFMECCV